MFTTIKKSMIVTKKDLFQEQPAVPSGPQPEGTKEGEDVNASKSAVSNEHTESSTLEERAEGDAGVEGTAPRSDDRPTGPAYFQTFSDKLVLGALPPLLEAVSTTQSDVELKDSMLLSSTTVLSGAMPNVYGIYGSRRVYPPFYSLVNAPAASNKGSLNACRYLLEPIERDIRKWNEQEKANYQKKRAEYLALDAATRRATPPPKEPPYCSLWIPANTTVSAVYQALADNAEWGVTMETEADTMTMVLQSEYGNYSDLLRKAFHHETCSLRRRKDNEFITVNEPRWSVMLTCTPGQIAGLLPSTENGLGSRFVFYNMTRKVVWLDMFKRSDKTLDEQFLELGERYKTIYDELMARSESPIEFLFSEPQQQKFNDFFKGLQLEQVGLYGDDLIAFVRRLGLVTFRLAMVLTVLRREGCHPIIEPQSHSIVCSDTDFNTAMHMANCLISHTGYVYTNYLPHNKSATEAQGAVMNEVEQRLYNALPGHFTTQEAFDTAIQLNINVKSAERYLSRYINKYHKAKRITNGSYQKL